MKRQIMTEKLLRGITHVVVRVSASEGGACLKHKMNIYIKGGRKL